MSNVLAFDVYGTLINTRGINQKLGEMIGCDTYAFSRMWRDKQLEYSFRRGLMKNYAEFSVCTRDALNYTCRHFRKPLSDEQKNQLLRRYRSRPLMMFGRVWKHCNLQALTCMHFPMAVPIR